MKRIRAFALVTCLALIVCGTIGVAATDIVSGPSIQLTDENEITLTFETVQPGMSSLQYGKTIELGQSTPLFYALDAFHKHVLPDIEVDTEYYYEIVVEDFLGNRSVIDSVFQSPALGDVSNVSIHGDSQGLILSWSGAFGAAGYEVLRGTSEDGPFEAIATVETTSFRDETVEDVGSAYYVVVAVTSDGAKGDPSPATAPEYITIDIKEWVNNDGIAWDDKPSDQNLDGIGWGFPAEELPHGDFALRWDSATEVPFKGFYTDDGEANNIKANEQEIRVPAGSYRGVWLLLTSTQGDSTGGQLTLNYQDGTQQVYDVSVTDWCLGQPADNEKMLLKPPYRMDQNGRDNLACGMWLMPEYAANPDSMLESIVLPKDPSGDTNLHVFGITLRL